MLNVYLNFISGVSLGLEIFTGDDLAEGDKFACTLDMLIFRITVVFSET